MRLDEREQVNKDEVKTVVQPDIVIVCDQNKLDERGCKGAPDLVVEVISKESALRDMKQKLDLYEKFGVKEYWIISPFEQIVWIYNLEVGNGEYGRPKIYGEDDAIVSKILAPLELKVKEIFASV